MVKDYGKIPSFEEVYVQVAGTTGAEIMTPQQHVAPSAQHRRQSMDHDDDDFADDTGW